MCGTRTSASYFPPPLPPIDGKSSHLPPLGPPRHVQYSSTQTKSTVIVVEEERLGPTRTAMKKADSNVFLVYTIVTGGCPLVFPDVGHKSGISKLHLI